MPKALIHLAQAMQSNTQTKIYRVGLLRSTSMDYRWRHSFNQETELSWILNWPQTLGTSSWHGTAVSRLLSKSTGRVE